MSGKFKRKDAAADVHSDDGADAAPPKKTSKVDTNNDDDDDNIVVCEISRNRRVSVRTWQGKVVVDIREFYSKDGKQLPGKKGLYLFFTRLFDEFCAFCCAK
ncbi:hypothetical protein RND81_09G232200 [Saponaria officinalis]|uniref:Transcriptional coactivator p15 (PC4) C-terminal domain-containing protein n=1 Tax=Saponaria officinalis TaxID=3572 RepID=A0AAW1IRF7_SAPOF